MFELNSFFVFGMVKPVGVSVRKGVADRAALNDWWRDIICKPFKKQHEEQLKLVTAFDWIDFSKLADCSGLITETLLADGAEEFIGKDRVKAIVSLVENRKQNLERVAAKGHREKDEVSIEGDVEENVAADYIG